jgi:hypothetical protein
MPDKTYLVRIKAPNGALQQVRAALKFTANIWSS